MVICSIPMKLLFKSNPGEALPNCIQGISHFLCQTMLCSTGKGIQALHQWHCITSVTIYTKVPSWRIANKVDGDILRRLQSTLHLCWSQYWPAAALHCNTARYSADNPWPSIHWQTKSVRLLVQSPELTNLNSCYVEEGVLLCSVIKPHTVVNFASWASKLSTTAYAAYATLMTQSERIPSAGLHIISQK
jgi:hypothetical protein